MRSGEQWSEGFALEYTTQGAGYNKLIELSELLIGVGQSPATGCAPVAWIRRTSMPAELDEPLPHVSVDPLSVRLISTLGGVRKTSPLAVVHFNVNRDFLPSLLGCTAIS